MYISIYLCVLLECVGRVWTNIKLFGKIEFISKSDTQENRQKKMFTRVELFIYFLLKFKKLLNSNYYILYLYLVYVCKSLYIMYVGSQKKKKHFQFPFHMYTAYYPNVLFLYGPGSRGW